MSGYRVVGRVGVLLVATALLGACGASATPSPSAGGPSASDQALVADVSAVFDAPFDAAKVAALYAPNAVLHEIKANVTSTGLEAIQARYKEFTAGGFFSKPTSVPIRQGDYVAFFETHGAAAGTESGLILVQLKDGKIQNQWVYPAP